MRAPAQLAVALALPLAACNQNSAVGNDREAQIDAAPNPAPIMGAAEALRNVDVTVIKPETMSGSDIAALGGLPGNCAVRLTEVAHPSFLFTPGGGGAIKLNGKLIRLSGVSDERFVDGELTVTLKANDETGDAGLQAIDMLIVRPGAKDELGYSGFLDCREETAS